MSSPSQSTDKDRVSIFIHDCQVELSIGFYESEWTQTQPVMINVECEARLTRRYDDIKAKDLSVVINYKPLYDFLTIELVQIGHIYLLESVAEQIFAFCFRDVRIERVRVRLEKTSIFPQAAGGGVEMTRTRL